MTTVTGRSRATPARRTTAPGGRASSSVSGQHRARLSLRAAGARGHAAGDRLSGLLHGLPLVLQNPAQPRRWTTRSSSASTTTSRSLTSDTFREVTINTLIWTVFSTLFSFLLGLLRRAGAEPGVHRPRRAARAPADPLRHQRRRRVLHLALALPQRLRGDRRAVGAAGASPTGRSTSSTISHTALPSLIVVNVWREFSFAMIMMLAGLQTVPDQLLRAAQVDGASAWQRFWHVTMPHLKGVTMVTVLLLLVTNLNSLHHPLHDDRRRAGRRDGYLDHLDLPDRLRPDPVRPGLGLLGDPVHRDDDAGATST